MRILMMMSDGALASLNLVCPYSTALSSRTSMRRGQLVNADFPVRTMPLEQRSNPCHSLSNKRNINPVRVNFDKLPIQMWKFVVDILISKIN